MPTVCVLLAFLVCFSALYCKIVAAFVLELKELDEKAYQEWGLYSVEEKLPYILDTAVMRSFEAEFRKLSLMTSVNGVGELVDVPVTYHTLLNLYGEFLQPDDVQQYMEACDRDRNEEVDLLEYTICRGEFDAYLSPHGLGEFDTLESVLIHDYEEKRNDPNYRIPGLQYDENGIIID